MNNGPKDKSMLLFSRPMYSQLPVKHYHWTIDYPSLRWSSEVDRVKPVFFLLHGTLSEDTLRNPKSSSSCEGLLWNYAIFLDRASPGLSSDSFLSHNFPPEQMTLSVMWKSKGRETISEGRAAWISSGLVDRAGAAMLFTLRDFYGSRLLQGHILPLLDLVRIDWWRDRLQIDDSISGTLELHWPDRARCDIAVY